MIDNKALRELERIKGLSAFNVQGCYAKKKMNQYCTHYYFNDGSRLIIKHVLGIGEAVYQCTRYATEIQVNARGV